MARKPRPVLLAPPNLDCRRCGACCVNARDNQAEGFVHWVEIEPDEPILRKERMSKRLIVLDDQGVPHLRMDHQGRCLELSGKVGVHVHCNIYPSRPRACHRVELGDERCLQYRRDQGLDP